MTAPARPPRLREGAEFGAALQLLDGDGPSTERLASGGEVVERRVAALVAGGTGVAAGTGAGAGAAATAAWLKIGLPVVLAVAAGGTYLATRPAGSGPGRPRQEVPTKLALAAAPAPDSIAPERRDAGVQPDTHAAGADAGADVGAAPGNSARAIDPARRPRSLSALALALDRDAGVAPGSATAPPPAADPPAAAPAPPPSSELPRQIRLFQAAKQAAQGGDSARALELLGQLLRRYPSSPLRAEARLSEAELLVRVGRLPAAASAVRLLLVDPQHAGRRAELHRVLGDVLRKQGDCPGAAAAYRRVLGGAAPPAEVQAARQGIAACTTR